MNPMDRLWALGAAIVALGIAAGMWFGMISPELDRASTAQDDLEIAEHQNTLHETRLLALEEAASRIDEYRAERDALSVGIPSGVEYSEFLRQVNALAEQHGVIVTAVTSSDPEIYLAPEGGAAPAESAPTTDDGTAPAAAGGTSSAGAADDPAAGASSDLSAATPETGGAEAPAGENGDPQAAPVPYADPLIGGDNLAAVPFSVTLEGGMTALTDFLHALQTGERLVSISTTTLVEGGDGAAPAIDPETGAEMAPTSEPASATVSGYLYVLHSGVTAPQP